jgi:hypothetical protein
MVLPFVIALAAAAAAQAGTTVDALTFTPPHKIVTLDKIKGEPIQLAWSPDGAQLYIETGEKNRVGAFDSPKHYLLSIADQKLKPVDAPPQWATEYQTWKANKWAAGDHKFVIDISEEKRAQRAVSLPMGGDLAKGGGSGAGTTADDVVGAALSGQMQRVVTLKLKGETVGEYVDTQFVPGYTFSWAPQSFGIAIAYARPDGHLSVMDREGKKKEIAATKNALLPAWASDGKQIAFMQKDGKKFDVYVTEVN